MQKKLWGNEYRTTMVCIDRYEKKQLTGRLYNSSLAQGKQFHSVMEFLLQMQNLLDVMRFPQPFMAHRSFSQAAQDVPDHLPELNNQEGALATFALRVFFQQNASWQGSVTWLEREKEDQFRSVLELLFLMDSALSDSHPLNKS